MNILPKKRWHVRTKANIARVRQDEAKAAEEEKELVRRAKLAEQEARTSFLRKQACERNLEACGASTTVGASEPPKESVVADIYTSDGNINFFKNLEDGKQAEGTNKEHEEEKRSEQEKYEKSIGLLKYLGQDSLEASGGKAWYEDEASRVTKASDETEVGLKAKSALDPIHDIVKYGGVKFLSKSVLSKPGNQNSGPELPDASGKPTKLHDSSKLKRKKHSKHAKHSKKRKHSKDKEGCKKRRLDKKTRSDRTKKYKKIKKMKSHKRRASTSVKHQSSRSTSDDSCGSGTSTSYSSSSEEKVDLEKLRAERLKREVFERQRAERLLAGKNPDVADEQLVGAPVQQKYNSQFNPHLAKQNREAVPLKLGEKYWL